MAGSRVVSYDDVLAALRGETRDGRTAARRSRIIDMGRLLRDGQRKTAGDGWNYPEWGRPDCGMFGTSTKRGAPHRCGGDFATEAE
ncbi:hypothetical protein GCM10010339_36690 [Streptomyces alanosinicus]|uniref:Uncharacterized protein n=1 Tax=Streptomyces alanosinicus TaxID=68171 RepID=A0A918YIU2_9ACTN|nr:hypothetical protein GCM10010339_36690 [Streptomyces alanosinicus]